MDWVRTNMCGTNIIHPNKNITAIKYKQQYEDPSEVVKYSAVLPKLMLPEGHQLDEN